MSEYILKFMVNCAFGMCALQDFQTEICCTRLNVRRLVFIQSLLRKPLVLMSTLNFTSLVFPELCCKNTLRCCHTDITLMPCCWWSGGECGHEKSCKNCKHKVLCTCIVPSSFSSSSSEDSMADIYSEETLNRSRSMIRLVSQGVDRPQGRVTRRRFIRKPCGALMHQNYEKEFFYVQPIRGERYFSEVVPRPLSPSGQHEVETVVEPLLESQGFFSLMGEFVDAVRKHNANHKDLSLGARTAAAFAAFTSCCKEWCIEVMKVVSSLLPDFASVHANMCAFFTAILNVLVKYAKEMSDQFNRLYVTIKSYFFPSEEVTDVTVELPSQEEVLIQSDPDYVTIDLSDQAGETVKTAGGKIWNRCCKIAVSFMSIICPTGFSSPKAAASQLRDYLSITSNIDRLGLLDKLKSATNWVYHKVTGKDLFIEFEVLSEFDDKVKAVEQLIAQQEKLANPEKGACISIKTSMEKIVALKRQVMALSPTKGQYINITVRDLQLRATQFIATVTGATRRIKPVSIFFRGVAGQGKSMAQMLIVKYLPQVISKMLKDAKLNNDHPAHEVWKSHSSVPSSLSANCIMKPQEYVGTGYGHQMFYCLEEVYTSVIGEINKDWSEQVFAMMDDAPYLLNSAFNDKGTVYFDSPFLIGTSNGEHVVPGKEPSAYFRRVDFDFEVKRGSGDFYTNKFILGPQVRAMLKTKLAPHDAFAECGFDLDKPLIFEQVLELIAVCYIRRITRDLTPERPVEEFDFMSKTFDYHKQAFVNSSVLKDAEGELSMLRKSARPSVAKPVCSIADDPNDVSDQKKKKKSTKESRQRVFFGQPVPDDVYTMRSMRDGLQLFADAATRIDDEPSVVDQGNDLPFWLAYAKAVYFSPFVLISSKSLYVNTYQMHHANGAAMDVHNYGVSYNFPTGMDMFSCYAKIRSWIGRYASAGYERLDEGTAFPKDMNERLFVRSLKMYAYAMQKLYFMSKVYYSPKKSKRGSYEQRSADRELLARVVPTWPSKAQRDIAVHLSGGWIPSSTSQIDVRAARAMRKRMDEAHFARQRQNKARINVKNRLRRESRTGGFVPRGPRVKSGKRGYGAARIAKEGNLSFQCGGDLLDGQTCEDPGLRMEVIDNYRAYFDRSYFRRVQSWWWSEEVLDVDTLEDDNLICAIAAYYTNAFPIGIFNSLRFGAGIPSSAFFDLPRNAHPFVLLTHFCYLNYISMNTPAVYSKKEALSLATVAFVRYKSNKHQTKNPLKDKFGGLFAFASTRLDTLVPNYAKYALYLDADAVVAPRSIVKMVLGALTAAALGAIVYAVYPMFKTLLLWTGSLLGFKVEPTIINLESCVAPGVLEQLNRCSDTTGFKFHSGENEHAVPKTKAVNAAKVLAQRLVNHSGESDVLNKHIANNSYIVTSQCGTKMGSALFVTGTIAIMNAHVFAAGGDSLILYAVQVCIGQNNHVVVPKTTVKVLKQCEDVVIINVGPGVRNHKNLLKHFASKEKIFSYGRPVASWAVTHDASFNMTVDSLSNYSVAENPVKVSSSVIVDDRLVTDRVSYNWAGAKPAACGTPICANLNGVCTIVGIHTAGNTSSQYGVAALVTSGMFDDTILYSQCGSDIALDDEEEGIYSYDVEKHVYITPYNTTATGYTTYCPTPFSTWDCMNVPKIPAILNNEAYKLALEKECSAVQLVVYKREVADIVEDFATEIADKFMETSANDLMGCRTLTFDEAMYGYQGKLDGFDFTTARGIRLRALGIKKKDLADPSHPSVAVLRRYVEERMEAMRNGDFKCQINADAMKDELRDHERVSSKKTRIFNVTDFVDNLIIKMAIGDLVSKFKDRMLFTPALCGINPTGSMWQEIYYQFKRYSNIVFSDIKGWDHMAARWITAIFGPWVTRCYGGDPGSFAVKLALWSYLAARQCLRFNRGFGRRLDRGNSSGNWCTTFFNTFDNHCFHCVALIYMAQENDIDALVCLKDFGLRLYSDDNISASKFAFWTVKNVATVFRLLFGITLTSTSKVEFTDESPDELYVIDDADFLSRSFVNRGNIIFAPLSKDSLLAQLYYVRVPKGKKSADFINQQLQINLENVSRELIEYDPRDAQQIVVHIRNVISSGCLAVSLPYVDYTNSSVLKLRYY
jgi:hypothetical protein